MELLHNGVDQSVIALWLGHESVETTQIYMHADLRLKERLSHASLLLHPSPGDTVQTMHCSPSSKHSDYAEQSRREKTLTLGNHSRRGIIPKAALCRYRHRVHSTGHGSRLNRTFGARFGDELYSKEELVAEMGAAYLCAIAGIANEHTDRNTTAYIQSWIAQLEQDNRLIVHAAANAQKAVDLIVGTTFEQEITEETGEAAASGLSPVESLAA
jgi:antirestriction protein ArdC